MVVGDNKMKAYHIVIQYARGGFDLKILPDSISLKAGNVASFSVQSLTYDLPFL